MKDVVRIISATLIATAGVAGAVALMTHDYDARPKNLLLLAILIMGLTAWCAVQIANTSDET